MQKVIYQTFPTSNTNLPPEAIDLFKRLRLDMAQLLVKISSDAKSNPQVDLNGAIEEAYLRALLVAGVLMPLPNSSASFIEASDQVH
jgi:hypothetical protein